MVVVVEEKNFGELIRVSGLKGGKWILSKLW